MSAGQYPYIEQDHLEPPSGNDLPTYDDLAQQNGPNSRFGRWRGWIEKRAAERYADITPEERLRRRERGWGATVQDDEEAEIDADFFQSMPERQRELNKNEHTVPLHVQTESLSLQDSPPISTLSRDTLSWDEASTVVPPSFVSQTIEPTHLKINHFGSRFLPHTTSQIRCILPLLADRILLIGHDEGLSVMNMFPRDFSESGGMATRGPDEAECRLVWRGESVYQMTILESEDNGGGTPQGVVLAIVGPSHDPCTLSTKDAEMPRTARMYNLGSLISLARWTIAQKRVKPLDLHYHGTPQTNTPSKKHKAQGSIARGLKGLSSSSPSFEPPSSYQSFLSPTGTTGPTFSRPPSVISARTGTDDSGWDIVDDLPLRWATDFVPLASPGSRLLGASVTAFTTWSDESRKGKGTGGQLLAIATKNNIILYETPKGERAYRFVKEFYTPMQPRGLAFIQQSVADARSPLEERSPGRFHSHKRSDSASTLRGVTNGASSPIPLSYGTHLSLFVIFDKKAGWIRLADSAVGEVELGDDGGPQPPNLLYSRDTYTSTMSASTIKQRARLSFDIRESAAKWILPIRCELPILGQELTQPVHILTRGKRTHIVPCPLPTRTGSMPPLHAVFWKFPPKHVSARLLPPGLDTINEPPSLQLIAFGENGLEVQEIGISFMNSKGKGRAYPEETLWAEEDLGGEAGFLAVGGNWDRLPQIYGAQAFANRASIYSLDSTDSVDIFSRMKREEGVYGWCRKGLEDWRVFWVGGRRDSGDQAEDMNDGATSLRYMNSTASSMYM